MLRKRSLKVVIAFLCIVTLLMPYTSNVLGALSQEDTSAVLTVLTLHEGGEESSGTLTGEYLKHYDSTPYKYSIAETTVFKIIEDGDVSYADALYCLNAEKSFPGILNNEQVGIEYKNVADLSEDTDANVVSLGLSKTNYDALMWLVNNMYLRKQAPEQKDEFLTRAFKTLLTTGITLDEIKATLTDDDIEVVQQWAMWNFTNSNVEKYTKFGAVSLLDPIKGKSGSYVTVTGSADRQVYAETLYKYLVKAALEGEVTKAEFPKITDTNITSVVDGEYYKVGPFNVTGGTSNNFELTLTDKAGNVIERSKYDILVEGDDKFLEKDVLVNEIFDVNYYIYLPIENNNITNLKLTLVYNDYVTEASLWTAAKEVYQPVALITREPKEVKDSVEVEIELKAYDLALRKYIVRVGNDSVNRAPCVDVTDLVSGDKTTAEYKHSKQPVEVKPGETVQYEIRVYNEGTIDGSALKIVDYLPEGLTLKEDSELNETYNWIAETKEGYTVVTTEYLKDEVLKAFDKDTMTEPDSATVKIECVVSRGLNSGKVLTNVAEIVLDDVYDRDSNKDSIDFTKIEESYTGHKDNKTDLTDSDYHYAGTEDDDDFEKLVIEGGTFDLNLKKFISKVNKVQPATSREPIVDVTPLKNGSSKNATYKTEKTPLIVEQGDIVLYTIRVYNEGEISGYAEEVADYLPTGLGMLDKHTVNVDNYWSFSDDVKSVKLESITNGMDNLSLEDFIGVTDLKSVDVIYGSKVVSTKLKSSDIDTRNLIDGFDPKKDTMLAYKDIQIACIVMDAEEVNGNFKNIAEIVKHSDEDKNTEVIDRDSVPNTVDTNNYPGNDVNQDDHDYENLDTVEPGKFDLSLQKVIVKLNDSEVNRDLRVSKENGKLKFIHVETALPVENGDLVTYRILVFNEGEVAGYAEEILDNIPEGLEFVQDNETNKKFGWKLIDKTGKETTDLNQAKSVRTDYLSRAKSVDNVIKAFGDESVAELENVGRLDYKHVDIVFKVNAKNKAEIINIAEISDDADEKGNAVVDIDSTPDNNIATEDDQDDEKIKLQEFDLSLKKFITAVNNKSITDREPKVSKDTNGKLLFATNKTPVIVANNDLVTYTIRVYNEGDKAGYAEEIIDNIPTGLEFVQDNETNKKYGWKLYDENKNETTDIAKAKFVKTIYLSRANNTNNLINAYNEVADISSTNPSYKDVQIVFKVIESKVTEGSRELINVAEIAKDADKDGNDVDDKDSIPNNDVRTEDDIDTEIVDVRFFDLALTKDLVKVIIVEDGVTREVNTNRDLMKVEINRRKLSSTTVKFVYNITVKNEGEIAGYASEITDYIPEGLEFIAQDNPNWKQESKNVISTRALENTLLEPGKTASVQVTLKWINSENNMGQKVNIAEISEDKNDSNTPDVDSTPDNRVSTEDDIDDAPVILSISTGAAPVYTTLVMVVLVILATGIVLIKKYVLL